MCPSCRSLLPTDQATLAMRPVAEAIREENSAARIPVIAYHDTIFPGPEIDVPQESFLLFAPRERCYGHALDDASCKRNVEYLRALKEWMTKYEGIDDAHTFEYYFDQLLFRGFFPFLPDVIVEDMRAYKEHGIETHMVLQCCAPAIATDYNMHLFADALWDEAASSAIAIEKLAVKILPENPQPWIDYLRKKADCYQRALRICDFEFWIYLDYRFLPENKSEFGKQVAENFAQASRELPLIADELKGSVDQYSTRRSQSVLQREL